MPRTWLDRLFAEYRVAKRLGDHDGIGSGRRFLSSFPVTTAGATCGAARQRASVAADAAWTIGVVPSSSRKGTPQPAANSRSKTRPEDSRTGKSALTRDLRMALTEGIDRAIFTWRRHGANPNAGDIVGLTTAAGLVDETTIKQADKVKGR